MGNNHSNTKTTLLISENSEKNRSNAEKNNYNNAELTQFTQKPKQKPDTSTSKIKHHSDTEQVTSSGDNVITDAVGTAKHKLSTSSNTM